MGSKSDWPETMARAAETLEKLGVPYALLAASILGNKHPAIRDALKRYRAEQTQTVLDNPDPRAQ